MLWGFEGTYLSYRDKKKREETLYSKNNILVNGNVRFWVQIRQVLVMISCLQESECCSSSVMGKQLHGG